MFALSLVLAWCSCAAALDPSLDISQYAHTAWKISEGFAKGVTHQFAQTPDGYLWLGTEYGLLRFDGVRTVRWQPPAGQHLPSEDVRGLIAGRDGTLWLGTAKGLASWKNGKFATYPELDGYDVYALLEDREGTAWAGGIKWEDLSKPGMLCAIKSGKAQCYGSDGRFGSGVTALQEDSRGSLWVGAANGLWRWKPGPPLRFELPGESDAGLSDQVRFFTLNGLANGDRDTLIIAEHQIAKKQGVFKFSDGKVEPYPFPSPPPPLTEATFLRDRDGSLWIGGRDAGLVHLHQGKMDVFTQADGLSSNWVRSMFEDREGSIWVATQNGIDRFREYAMPTISMKQGLSSSNVSCVLAAKDGSVWLGTTDGLNRWKDGQISVYRAQTAAAGRQSAARDGDRKNRRGDSVTSPPDSGLHEVIANGLPDSDIRSLYQDPQGRIWISTHRGLAYFENGSFFPLREEPRSPSTAIVGARTGNLWLADAVRGLVGLRMRKLAQQVPWARLGIRGAVSNPLAVDPVNGGVWIGSWNGGVVYFREGQVRESYGTDSGLGAGRVYSLQFDSSGVLWAATEGGLSRIRNGHVITLTSNNGLPCDTAYDLLEDNEHSFWLYGACGLARIARTELDAWVANPKQKIGTTVFDIADGVRSQPGVYPPTPRSAKAADGRLWFLPLNGALVVDPHRLPTNGLPPPVHIEQIIANGHAYEATRGLRLPSHIHDLVIDYTALSMVAPEKVRFRFMLEGQDRDWREVVNDREVQYSNLDPGPYRFRVIACNNSGVWNEQGDTLEFSVAPAYYQTNWFRALCAVLVLALLWAAYQWRLRQIHHQFEIALEARVGERTRIAREIHDTLLQSFHGVLLRLEILSQVLRVRPMEAQQTLDRTIDEAAKAITEGRDAVQGLRESTVQGNDLARAVNTVGEELAADPASNGSAAFRVTVEGEPRDLHPILRDEIYRIAAEALRNAFRHAQARQVEVEIRYDDEQFRLRVRDDGKGMDKAVPARQVRGGHYGLPGMRERAKLVGGNLTVWSEVDAGTEVELKVPAATAYAGSGKRAWLSRLLIGKR